MRLWAYGTSPHGLGLSEQDFWMLSPREYYALADVQESETRRWAVHMAMMLNMNMSKDSVAFTADDFLGLGDRETRVREKQVGDLRVQRLNQKLSQMLPGGRYRGKLKQGEEPPDLPLWAQKNPKKPDETVN